MVSSRSVLRRDSRHRRSALVAAALVAVFALLLVLHSAQPFRGDEPHYLVLTTSLILDGDVDVKNNYLAGDTLRYFDAPIDPHVNGAIFDARSTHWYSQHGVGLSAVLVPGVVAADTKGATLTMVLLALVVLVLAFLWTRRFTDDRTSAGIATAALGLSPFFLGLEGRIFPDLAAAALLLGCLLLLELPARRGRELVLLSVLIGLSPWFHFKNALAFATVAAIALVQIARNTTGKTRVRLLLALLLPAFVSALGYEIAVRTWYASWLPTHMYSPNNQASLDPLRGLAANSFDSARGLLVNDPALLLLLVGVPIWLRRWRGPFLRLALVLGPTILVQAGFSDWSGGYSPPGRYTLQFVPALLPAIGLLVRRKILGLRVLVGLLLGLNWTLAAAFVWLRPQWGSAGFRSPLFNAIQTRLGPALDRAAPAFDGNGRLLHGEWQLVAWLVLSGALVVYGGWLARGGARTAGEMPVLPPAPFAVVVDRHG